MTASDIITQALLDHADNEAACAELLLGLACIELARQIPDAANFVLSIERNADGFTVQRTRTDQMN